jgi:hypothetical protein
MRAQTEIDPNPQAGGILRRKPHGSAGRMTIHLKHENGSNGYRLSLNGTRDVDHASCAAPAPELACPLSHDYWLNWPPDRWPE